MKLIGKNNFAQFDSHLVHSYSPKKIKPKVSICLITYNQEKYISKAIQSILDQVVNFEYEIVLGDDCSTDGNRKIIQNFINKYPEKFKVFFHKYNLGPKHSLAKNNFLHTFFNCGGEYIVHIEADDYLTNINKLQKQVDFLDKNPDLSACFHNAIIKWDDWDDRPDEFVNPPNQKEIIVTADLLAEKETWFMATASVMMRRKLVNPLPAWFFESVSGDIPLYIILASQGNIGYLPDAMCVYRKNLSGQSFAYKLSNAKFVRNRIKLYKNLNIYTKGKYSKKIDEILADYYGLLAKSVDFEKNIFARFYCTLISIKYRGNYSKLFLKETIRANTMQSGHLNSYYLKKWFVKDIFNLS